MLSIPVPTTVTVSQVICYSFGLNSFTKTSNDESTGAAAIIATAAATVIASSSACCTSISDCEDTSIAVVGIRVAVLVVAVAVTATASLYFQNSFRNRYGAYQRGTDTKGRQRGVSTRGEGTTDYGGGSAT